jgi:predicted Zn-dependent peptidase
VPSRRPNLRARRTPIADRSVPDPGGDLHLPIAPTPYKVFRDQLSNGLRICTVEAQHLHWATVALYVRAGSRYETPVTNGLSHFVEHMLFRGSSHYPDSYALNRAIEEMGGTLYAETGRDYSLYQISLHPARVPGALEILGDLFSSPSFKDIDLERNIILEEILEDFDERGRKVNIDDLSREAAWPEHPLGYSIVGPAANVRRFGVPDVRRHFRRLYGGKNMVLCVAGRVRRSEVAAAAKKFFGGVAPGTRAVPRKPRPVFDGPRFRRVWSDSAQTQLQLLFYALPEWDPGYAALVALLRVLDDGMSTRLHYQVCDQKGLAYNVNAALEPLFDTALLELDAACAHQKLPELLTEVLRIIGEFRDELVTPGELDKAKRRYLFDLEAGFDDLDGLCGWFGGTELFFRPYTHEERVRRMDRVTAEEVREVARRVLRADRLTAVAVGALESDTARKVQRLLRAF